MNPLPPNETQLETQLRAHFDDEFRAQYGEPLATTVLWDRVEPQLHSPTTRLRMALDGALSPPWERLQHWLRAVHPTDVSLDQEVDAMPAPQVVALRRPGAARILAALAPVAAVLVIVALAAILFIPRLMQPAFPTPANWHDITPPTPQAITSYAVSPDVPGLILACIGSRAGSLSASPMGPAHIWRTRDGGASWERLSQPVLTAGCQIAPLRGEPGTFFAEDGFANPPALWSTHDQGSTWTQIPVSDQVNPVGASGSVSIEFQLLAQGVYRDGALYAAGSLNHGGTSPADISSFSVTRDDGRTWTRLEVMPDGSLSNGYMVTSIAADYRASGAWYRLLTNAGVPQTASSAADALLEHSADNGRSWAVVSRIKVAGGVAGADLTELATSSSSSGRVCVALDAETFTEPSASAPSSARIVSVGLASVARSNAHKGPPAPLPTQVSLYASDDGGATWHGGSVANYSNAYGGPVLRGVGIDGAGNCYLATTYVEFTSHDTTTIWRLAPGASVVQPAMRLQGTILSYFALALGPGGGSSRLVGLASKAGPLVAVTCYDTAPCVEPTPAAAHLIWTDAP